VQSYKSKIKKRFQVINSLKDYMEQGFRYEKDCLSKKGEATCIGNGNSGENPKRFNGKRTKKEKKYPLWGRRTPLIIPKMAERKPRGIRNRSKKF